MNAIWLQIGFFAFVLAPLWATFLAVLSGPMAEKGTLGKVLVTLFLVIAVQTFIADLIFICIGLGGMEQFVSVWQFFWAGPGLWWWVWSVAGFLVATAWEIMDYSGDTDYVKRVFLCTFFSAIVFLFILFLLNASQALAESVTLG